VEAGIAHSDRQGAFNVCDDEAAPPDVVTAYAAGLLGVPSPPLEDFETAKATMSEMALSFWADNKRVSNAKMKTELGVALAYPTYREGLAAMFAAETRGKTDGK
jgi:hypothetical protein